MKQLMSNESDKATSDYGNKIYTTKSFFPL